MRFDAGHAGWREKTRRKIKPCEPHRRHPETRQKTHDTSNHEELERLLNQTVVLTELTAPPTVFIVAERRQEVALKPGNRETSLTGGSASLLGIYIYPQLLRLRSERLNFRLRLRKGRRRLRKQVSPKYSEASEVKTDSKLKKRKHLITN